MSKPVPGYRFTVYQYMQTVWSERHRNDEEHVACQICHEAYIVEDREPKPPRFHQERQEICCGPEAHDAYYARFLP